MVAMERRWEGARDVSVNQARGGKIVMKKAVKGKKMRTRKVEKDEELVQHCKVNT